MGFGTFLVSSFLACLLLQACGGEVSSQHISARSFRHHYIVRDLPGEKDWGYGTPAMGDFDRDGDLDYAFCSLRDHIYWYETLENGEWERRIVGPIEVNTLGGIAMDVDGDSWEDIVIGGYWYRNSQSPSTEEFERFRLDSALQSGIHDIAVADIDGDGVRDVIMTGDHDGTFWYRIPENPLQDVDWERSTITLDVLVENDAIHAGFFPRGVADLDGDGDADVVMPDRWYENRDLGREWPRHPLPFGKRGPWGLSSRSWIIDLDKDGDSDIVMTDCDQQASRAAWLENHGDSPPTFTAHFLPMTAPGVRGSFHSLAVADFDGDGDMDIFTCDQEDDSIFPEGAFPRWYIWENVGSGPRPEFVERVIFDGRLGGHDALVADVDGDGDLDIFSKVWNLWPENANGGREHGDFLENLTIP
jgi:hypothetical protein